MIIVVSMLTTLMLVENLKRLSFRKTDEKSNTMNLYEIPVQFSLIFKHVSF